MKPWWVLGSFLSLSLSLSLSDLAFPTARNPYCFFWLSSKKVYGISWALGCRERFEIHEFFRFQYDECAWYVVQRTKIGGRHRMTRKYLCHPTTTVIHQRETEFFACETRPTIHISISVMVGMLLRSCRRLTSSS